MEGERFLFMVPHFGTLPPDIRAIDSYHLFRQSFEAHVFREAFKITLHNYGFTLVLSFYPTN